MPTPNDQLSQIMAHQVLQSSHTCHRTMQVTIDVSIVTRQCESYAYDDTTVMVMAIAARIPREGSAPQHLYIPQQIDREAAETVS